VVWVPGWPGVGVVLTVKFWGGGARGGVCDI
jgi:hypothetical protein